MALEVIKQVRSGPTNDNGTRCDLNVHAAQHKDVLAMDSVGEGDESHSIARLKGRSILAESNVAVAQKQLNDFEKSRHLYSFEIGGEQWSLVRVDRQQRVKERQIDYSKRAISAYRMRLYGAINNPLKLYGLRGYKENAATAKEQIKEARGQIDDLRQIRETVTSCLDERRAGLKTTLQTETQTAQKLNQLLNLNLDLHLESDKENTVPQFTERELDQLEANARILRDPKLLQSLYQHFERHYGMTARGIEMIAARAGEILDFAKACLADVNDGIRAFSENREFVPVRFKDTSGEERTTTVSELDKQPVGQNILARIFNNSPSPLELVNEALNQRAKDFLQERTTINSFVDAASDFANHYRQKLTANLRTDIAALNQPTESHDAKEITHDPRNADEHLKQIRQNIDRISLQNGAINETGIEAGIAEAEAATTESLAALI